MTLDKSKKGINPLWAEEYRQRGVGDSAKHIQWGLVAYTDLLQQRQALSAASQAWLLASSPEQAVPPEEGRRGRLMYLNM